MPGWQQFQNDSLQTAAPHISRKRHKHMATIAVRMAVSSNSVQLHGGRSSCTELWTHQPSATATSLVNSDRLSLVSCKHMISACTNPQPYLTGALDNCSHDRSVQILNRRSKAACSDTNSSCQYPFQPFALIEDQHTAQLRHGVTC